MSHRAEIQRAYKHYAKQLYLEHPAKFREFKANYEDIMGYAL